MQIFHAFFEKDRDDHDLLLRHSVRTHEALVVAVRHDKYAHRASGEPPGGLPRLLEFVFLVLLTDVKHFGEVLTQIMGSSCLDGPIGPFNIPLDGFSEECTCKFLIL